MTEKSKAPSMSMLNTVSEKSLAVRKGEMIEGEYTVLCDGHAFVVQNNIEQSRKKLRYTQKYDPQTAAGNCYSEEEVYQLAVDSPYAVSGVKDWVKESTPVLTAAEKKARKNTFLFICYTAATPEGMTLLVRAASRKKDGTFIKNRVISIAKLQAVSERGETWEVYAKAVDSTTLELGVRKKEFGLYRLNAGTGEAPCDFIDQSDAFMALCGL